MLTPEAHAAAVRRADDAADEAGRVVGRCWRALLAVLREEPSAPRARPRVLALALPLRAALTAAVRGRLLDAGRLAHRDAALSLAQALPLSHLRAATMALRLSSSRPGRRRNSPPGDSYAGGRIREAKGHGLAEMGLAGDAGANPAGRTLLREADALDLRDLLEPLREPSGLSEAERRRLFRDLLFPPPSLADILHLLNTGPDPWYRQLARATRLAGPEQLAAVVATGYSLGETQRQIAARLLPLLDGVRTSARRVARTEGLRVAGAVQMEMHRALGDLVIGYRLLATHDRHSRPWHAARDGTVYYLRPGPGQKGPAQMPRPPEEPADPAERPPGTPQTAFNCRCTLIPVLRDPGPAVE